MQKKCTKCQIEKPLSYFNKHRGRSDGLNNICRTCKKVATADHYRRNKSKVNSANREYAKHHIEERRKYDAAYYLINKDRLVAQNAKYRADRKDFIKALNRKYYLDHKSKILAKNAEYKSENPDRWREYHRTWGQNWTRTNPIKNAIKARRYTSRKHGAVQQDFSDVQLLERFSVFGDRCAYCGAPWSAVDHLKPLVLGGPNCLANFRPACRTCNSKKGSTPAKKWLAKIGRAAERIPLP